MKLENPIEVDMFKFFETGAFDALKLGQSNIWVQNNFPDPDSGFDAEMKRHGFDIWTYGDIELHFENEILFLIFADNIGDLNGGKDIVLNRWIFEDYDKLNLLHVMEVLNSCNIDFKKLTDEFGVLLRLKSGVELTFENIKDVEGLSSNAFMMTSFCLVAENPHRWRDSV